MTEENLRQKLRKIAEKTAEAMEIVNAKPDDKIDDWILGWNDAKREMRGKRKEWFGK